MSEDTDPLIRPGLEKILIDNKIISRAQADVALADQEMTGMSFEEVVLIRGWVDKATLYKLAPWLSAANESNQSQNKVVESEKPANSNYQENLATYRQLMEKILGKNRPS
jgi:hypothetical protein